MKTDARVYAILAAALFGASAPFSKLLLEGVSPLQLAGLLYLGSGILLLPLKGLQIVRSGWGDGPRFQREEWFWLLGAVVSGGFLGPVLLMYGLSNTPAATASMLLNFEAAATTVLASLFFREHIGRRVVAALALLTLACTILAFDGSGRFGFSFGALCVLAACVMWGADNNFTRNISSRDPMMIVIVKGIGAGSLTLVLSWLAGDSAAPLPSVLAALGLGALSYGASLLLFIRALRDLGSARTSALMSSAPFAGALMSFLIFPQAPELQFWMAIPLMLAGILLLFSERHGHAHGHEAQVHDHDHVHDEHHLHGHGQAGRHRHVHRHEALVHEHDHLPDIHHRHGHSSAPVERKGREALPAGTPGGRAGEGQDG
jgi:drug/metabolite transporter (DMT)-like permease